MYIVPYTGHHETHAEDCGDHNEMASGLGRIMKVIRTERNLLYTCNNVPMHYTDWYDCWYSDRASLKLEVYDERINY